MNAHDDPDATDDCKSFSKWTDDEILNLAEQHRDSAPIRIDYTRAIVREDHDVAYVPAWIEVCPWDGLPARSDKRQEHQGGSE